MTFIVSYTEDDGSINTDKHTMMCDSLDAAKAQAENWRIESDELDGSTTSVLTWSTRDDGHMRATDDAGGCYFISVNVNV